MKISLNAPDAGKSNGEIHLFDLSEMEYQAAKEELKMLFDLLHRIYRSEEKRDAFKHKIEAWKNANK